MSDELDRNDPCHCGSGRKYKNCCLDKDNRKLTSKLWMVGLVIIFILGLWFLGTAIWGQGGDNAADCPAGQVWSEAHQHCH